MKNAQGFQKTIRIHVWLRNEGLGYGGTTTNVAIKFVK